MTRIRPILFAALLLSLTSQAMCAAEDPWYSKKTTWNGFDQFHFRIADRAAYIVAPAKAKAGNPWVWRARFPGYHAEMDVTLVKQGFHVSYVDVGGMFGSPRAVEIGNKFYEFVTKDRGLSRKPALEGVSRGGLFVYNWAVKNLDKVACIYCDTPVCDFKSWPGGKGNGVGSAGAWKACLQAYGMTEKEALNHKGLPLNYARQLAEARIPILHIVSENDRVVPPAENTYVLRDRLKSAGHKMDVISVAKGTEKSKGHHFTHPAQQRVVTFISRNASDDRMPLLRTAKRIVFLGDSITYAGEYVACFQTWLIAKTGQDPLLINVGLPSETVSGLSEDGHAGGRFPRPDLFERLDRVLKVTKPDLVFACYGINCGIYQPFEQKRFDSYTAGIRRLKERVEATGAKLILVTPPTYDDKRRPKKFSYNGVMERYSAWLKDQQKSGWMVVDLHSQMNEALASRRKEDPKFTFQPDAVHPNKQGHWLMASALIRWFGDAESAEKVTKVGVESEVLDVVRKRMQLRRGAYLSAAGHKRPGIRKGVSVEEAERQAKALAGQIQKLLKADD